MEDTLQQVRVVLWENRAAPGEQSDRLTIEHLRTLVSCPDVKRALKRRGEGRLALALRALQALFSEGRGDRDAIERVWRVVDDGDLEADARESIRSDYGAPQNVDRASARSAAPASIRGG